MTNIAKAADFNVVPHTMNRIDVSTGVGFDQFRAAFEKAAPAFDLRPRWRSPNAVAVGMKSVQRRRLTRRTGRWFTP